MSDKGNLSLGFPPADGAPDDQALFYVQESTREIWKRPVSTALPGGGQRISIGFPVCTVHPAADPAAVARVLEKSERLQWAASLALEALRAGRAGDAIRILKGA